MLPHLGGHLGGELHTAGGATTPPTVRILINPSTILGRQDKKASCFSCGFLCAVRVGAKTVNSPLRLILRFSSQCLVPVPCDGILDAHGPGPYTAGCLMCQSVASSYA